MDRFSPPTSERNWEDLGDGPAGLIADRVLAYDVADYVRFRAVCRPWRRCSDHPRAQGGLDRRFHPWRWTMIREELAVLDRRSFLNTSTGECVQVDVPELRHHFLLAVTPEGLLVLVHKRQRSTVRLLNPLTRHIMELPPLTTLLPPKNHNKLSENYDSFDEQFAAWGSGIANDDSTVVLCFNGLRVIGMAKPGDGSWRVLEYRTDGMTTTPLMFAGRFYCVNLSGVMVLEMGADQPPRLEVAAKLNMRVWPAANSLHLVNNGGDELMLVHRWSSVPTSWNKSGMCYNAYRVDLDTKTLFWVRSLGGGGGAGRALFMGLCCSLSVPLEVFPSGCVSADTIYLSFDLRERVLAKAGAYHLADGSFDLPCKSVTRPHTLVDCLSLSNTSARSGTIAFP
jgi:hypothetical protein